MRPISPAIALALVASLASCSRHGDDPVAVECAAMAPALSAVVAHASAIASERPAPECAARAARLWLAERNVTVLSIAHASEQQLLASDPALRRAVGDLESEIAVGNADIAGQTAAAVGAGCPAVVGDGGARAVLEAWVLRDIADRARTIATACSSNRASLKAGDATNLVGSVDTILPDVRGGEHDVVLHATALALSRGGAL